MTNTRKTIISTVLAAGLFLLIVDQTQAFMGMGGFPHGGAMNLPQPDRMGQKQEDTNNTTMMAHAENDKTVVARVFDTEITMGALMHKVKEVVMMGYRNAKMTKELAKRIRYESLEKLAMEELAYQRALSIGITVNQADIDRKLEAITEVEGGEEALQASLTRQKKTLDELKMDISRFLAVKQAIEQQIDSKVIVTEEEINRAYQANKETFVTPERVVISDIVFFLDPEDKTSGEKVRSIREKIIDELDNDPTKLTPSDFVVLSDMDVSLKSRPNLYEAAKKMEVGDLSDPLLIDGTLHLVKFEAYQARKEKPENEAKESVARKIKSFKRQQLLAKWRQSLIKDADIEIVHEMLK